MNIQRVTFNVCGKRYQTNRSVIEAKPDTMLAMLLRNQSPDETEIFVQGDPYTFRWILYYYTSDILVDNDTAGVSEEVWEREIDYYSLFSAEEKKEDETRKRALPVDESHELASLAKKHLVQIYDEDDLKRQKRHEIYKLLLEYMMDRMHHTKDVTTAFAFIGRSTDQKPINWPEDYPHQLRGIDFKDINSNFEEFVVYCKQVHFCVKKVHYAPSYTGKAKFLITNGYVKTQHQSITISISLLKE